MNTDNTKAAIERFIKIYRVVGLSAGLVLMTGFMAGGFMLFGRSALTVIRAGSAAESGTYAAALVEALEGLEFLFLSPLAFLIFLTLVRFVRNAVIGDVHALDAYRVVKSLVINLMIAIVATDLVRKIAGNSGLTLTVACTELLVIAVFVAYVLVIEPRPPDTATDAKAVRPTDPAKKLQS